MVARLQRATILLARSTVLVAAASLAACAHSSRTLVDVPLAPYLGRLRTVDIRLGEAPLRMIFDTGAGKTLVTPDVAARLRCTPRGRSVGWRMNGEQVEFPLCDAAPLAIAARDLGHVEYGVFDLARVLPAGVPPVDGILGLDALVGRHLRVALSAARLRLETRTTHVDSGWREVPMRVATGIDGSTTTVFLGATLPTGQPLWLELDSGNLDSVLLAPWVATHLGIDDRNASSELDLQLGQLTVTAIPVAVRDLVHDGALNAAFLEGYDVRLDLDARRAWLRPVGAPQDRN